MEDGTDLNGFKSLEHNVGSCSYPNQIWLDINQYMIKYDYDIAAALSPDPKVKTVTEVDCQNRKRFSVMAYKELLAECSKKLTGGQK